jgi:hypothetical protein
MIGRRHAMRPTVTQSMMRTTKTRLCKPWVAGMVPQLFFLLKKMTMPAIHQQSQTRKFRPHLIGVIIRGTLTLH